MEEDNAEFENSLSFVSLKLEDNLCVRDSGARRSIADDRPRSIHRYDSSHPVEVDKDGNSDSDKVA